MRLNKRKVVKPVLTHEGAPARRVSKEQTLLRLVLSCMLWEPTFYKSGSDIAQQIYDTAMSCDPEFVAELAVKARHEYKLRHVPLWLIKILLDKRARNINIANLINDVIRRPDEITELLAMYWKDGKVPIAKQLAKGINKAFTKFSEYQLAKWNRKTEITLKDVMCLTHPTPINDAQYRLWGRLIEGRLLPPETWEVLISKHGNRADVWERLLLENKLGGLALLRNLRNMQQVGVDRNLIKQAILNIKSSYILPFRYIAAAKHAPALEPYIEKAMLKSLTDHKKLPGSTVLLVDVSGSMKAEISKRSDLTRMDAAVALAILLREICEEVSIYSFSCKLVEIAPRHGFALSDAIIKSQKHSSTYLGHAVKNIYAERGSVDRFKGTMYGNLTFYGQGLNPDRLIVFTDEQSHDPVPNPQGRGYMINVASYKHGVGYKPWIHVDGFSEAIVQWIQMFETEFGL